MIQKKSKNQLLREIQDTVDKFNEKKQIVELMLMEIDQTDIIVHIGDMRVETKIEDLAKKMIKIVGSNIELEAITAPVGSVSRRLPNTELLNNLTGFEPTISLDKGLQETYLWYSKQK